MFWSKSNEPTVTDEQLQSPQQHAVKSLVNKLSSEEPSLAWRSQLNLKLIAAADAKIRRKKIRTGSLLTSGFSLAGLAAYAAIALVGSTGPANRSTGSASFDDTLYQLHTEAGTLASVSGSSSASQPNELPYDPAESEFSIL